MSKLKIAEGLSLPIEAVTEKLGFLGRTGSGKTYAAQKLAEEMHRAGAQFVALDPVGVWWGLRLAANGKGPGIPIPVLGGLRGDVPLEPTAGKLIADLVVDRGTSVVVDVSQFESDADKARFAMDFAARFFFRKKASPSAVHIFVEESQEFVPQNPMRDEARMLHAFQRLAKLGRNFGIGMSLISQRPQEVNKKVLNQVELLFAFQMTGPQERKTIDGWISEKGIDEDIAGELPKLKRGSPHVWSPAWLRISEVVAIASKWTFDGSSTPKVGGAAKVRELAPIDIEQLGKQILDTRERAKAEDPKELRKTVAELERKLRQAEKGNGQRKTEKIVVDEKAIERAVGAAVSAERKRFRPVLARLQRLATPLSEIPAAIGELATILNEMPAPIGAAVATGSHAIRPEPSPTPPRPPRAKLASSAESETLSGLHQRIVNGLAELRAIGVEEPTREQLAFYLGVSSGGGYFTRVAGELKTGGFVDYPQPGKLTLLDQGTAAATQVEPPMSIAELHDRVRRHLSGLHERIFDAATVQYPKALTREQLADVVGTAAGGGYFTRVVGELKTAGILEYPVPGEVRATELLFPEALS